MLRCSLGVFSGYKFLKPRSIISLYDSLTERRKSWLFDYVREYMHTFIPAHA